MTARHQTSLAVFIGVLLLAQTAFAETTVWLKFPALPAPPPQAQRDAVKAGLEVKYAFEPNIKFTFTQPATGTANVFIINFLNGSAAAYGDSNRAFRQAWVFRGNITPGTDGHPESNMFPTATEQQNAMIDTAAHELGHLFGIEHNCNAPNAVDTEDSPDGNTTFKRKPGNGTLVGGRPGLMADGRKVLPSELAADARDFTAGEKEDIEEFIAKLKGVTPTPNDPRRGNTNSSKTLKTIRGQRQDPVNSVPPFPNEVPCPRICPLVDIHVQLFQNAGWEFGYVAIDGTFRKFIDAGAPEGDLAREAGQHLDFAIHQPGAPLTERVSFTEGPYLPQPSQQVPPNFSVEPAVAQPYFRSVMLQFDTPTARIGGGGPPVFVMLTLEAPDVYDGLLPVPGCPSDFNNINGTTVQDLFDFLKAWFAQCTAVGPAPCQYGSADFNSSGLVTVQDLFDFLAAWFGQC